MEYWYTLKYDICELLADKMLTNIFVLSLHANWITYDIVSLFICEYIGYCRIACVTIIIKELNVRVKSNPTVKLQK